MTNIFFYFLVFVFGLCFGSFANVLVLRDNQRMSILMGRSECPGCHYDLKWYDLIPLVSFLMLLGRCRSCRKKISIQYPLLELFVGILAVLVAWFGLQNSLALPYTILYFFSFYLLTVVSLIDIREMAVPIDYVVLAGICGGLAQVLSGSGNSLDSLRGLVIGAGLILLITFTWKLVTKTDGMGEGDAWIAGTMGLILGYPLIIVALVLAVFSGAIIGVLQIVLDRKKLQTAIPFGPYLSLGAFLALLVGQSLIQWYILFVWI